jgi:hypothetical protein
MSSERKLRQSAVSLSNNRNFPRPMRSTNSLIDNPKLSDTSFIPVHPASVTLMPRVFFGSSYRTGAPALERFANEFALTRFAIYLNLRTLHIDLSIKLMVYRIIAEVQKAEATIHVPHATRIRLKNHPADCYKESLLLFLECIIHTARGYFQSNRPFHTTRRRKSKTRDPPRSLITDLCYDPSIAKKTFAEVFFTKCCCSTRTSKNREPKGGKLPET